ncbi:putative ABC transporter ATP-binding protein YbhF [Hydrogenovibrio crunogenus]|uniref:Putative ABC transporter ATP-binding protein YbhF n=1 Tax=Hydrogenovibrio crunogenus TaxID=39765 RepID=A0A4P7NZM2_9GAMM|nr:ATP-binding cassette domain-containing protein [Hydrogenovibrio crunogenus]QBZ83158.1 putative ABC transporter ATP-binding protein YbhF [Hydrogenovibrio crunogenus]
MHFAVQVSRVSKHYRKKVAFEDISIEIQTGEIYGLIGPDGSGKSSLMQAIAGVLTYNSGDLCVFDTLIDSEKSAEKIKHRIGFMPQGLGLNLYPDLSIEENIDFFANLRGVSSDLLQQRKEMLLSVAKLTPFKTRPMKNLSGGMKQKLGLVCTLIHQPELIILDEPTTGVDPISRRDFWEMLNRLVMDEGMTALVSTAYMDEASRFNRLSVMHQGKVLVQGRADDIIAKSPGWVVEIETSQPSVVLARLKVKFETVEQLGQMIRLVIFDQEKDVIESILKEQLGSEEHQWYFLPIGLEEFFIHHLKNHSSSAAKRLQNPSYPISQSPTDKDRVNTDEPLIQADNLIRRFGDFIAADQVTFEVRPGEIFGLLGANGAGKSTVIKMLTGILPPTDGAGFVANQNMAHSGMAIKESIGYMSQAFSLYLDLTVLENIKLFGRIYGLSGERLQERIDWVIDVGHLQSVQNEPAGSLPMGKRQRLALGCALIHQPKVLFLDEPTSGVDPIGRSEFWRILVNLASEWGVAILITTHYMLEAEHCHRLALMQAGKIVAYDTPVNLKQTLKQQKGQVLSVNVSHPYRALSCLQKAGYDNLSLFGNRLQLFSKTVSKTKNDVVNVLKNNQIEIKDTMVLQPSLEDVFVDRIETALAKHELR